MGNNGKKSALHLIESKDSLQHENTNLDTTWGTLRAVSALGHLGSFKSLCHPQKEYIAHVIAGDTILLHYLLESMV